LGVDTTRMSVNDAAQAAVREVDRLVRQLNIPTLLEQGVNPEDIERYAQAAFEDPQTVGNPRDIGIEGYRWLYRRCLGLEPST
jgi:choline dehydrogenase